MDKKLSTLLFFISTLEIYLENDDETNFKSNIFNLSPSSSSDTKSFNIIKYAILKDFDEKKSEITFKEFINNQIELCKIKYESINDIKKFTTGIENFVESVAITIPEITNNIGNLIDNFKKNIVKELEK